MLQLPHQDPVAHDSGNKETAGIKIHVHQLIRHGTEYFIRSQQVLHAIPYQTFLGHVSPYRLPNKKPMISSCVPRLAVLSAVLVKSYA